MLLTGVLVLAVASAGLPNGMQTRAVADAARIWVEVRYRHPAVMMSRIDWDQALVDAVPELLKARSEAEARQALEAMLGRLDDPGTALVTTDPEVKRFSTFDTRWIDGETLFLLLRPLDSYRSLEREMKRLEPELDQAKRLVLDLRGQPPAWTNQTTDLLDALDALAPWMFSPDVSLPPTGVVQRQGFVGSEPTSGNYDTRLAVALPKAMEARGAARRRVAIVIDRTASVPPLVIGLQQSGRATVVALGKVRPGVHRVGLVRISPELQLSLTPAAVLVDRWEPEVQLQPAQAGSAVETALKLLDAAPSVRRPAVLVEPLKPEAKDRDYPDLHPPGVGLRVLALARVWGTIHFFYPYLDLLDVDWDQLLEAAVPAFLAAETDELYARALIALANQITDGHTGLRGPAVDRLIPRAWLPVSFLLLKEGLTVARVGSSQSPLRPGDVIRKVDGEALEERMQRMSALSTASTPAAHRYRAALLALGGAAGSTAHLEVWDGARSREVEIQRVPFPTGAPESSPPFRILPDGAGYVDLTSLEVSDVPRMISELGRTPAIVFDMRGYPRGTAWSIGPWLNRKKARFAAAFREPWLSGDALDGRVTYQFLQPFPPTTGPTYLGRVSMLFDERAISQSEHTALFFEQATDVLFVGSPSAGANGDVAALPLPGGLLLRFTGHDVRHLDGRQLQRVGIRPDIPVRPTAAGLRAGRDEVLERALRELRAGTTVKARARAPAVDESHRPGKGR